MTSLFEWAELSVLEGHIIAASLKGALLMIIAAALCLALRRSSAAVRHFVWSLALTGLLALPLLSVGLPTWHIAVLPASSIDSPSTATDSSEIAPSSRGTMPMSRITSMPIPSGNEPLPTNARISPGPETDLSAAAFSEATTSSSGWVKWALMIWLAVALLFLGRLLIGIASIWWIAHRANRVTDAGSLKLANDIAGQIGVTRRVSMFKSSRTAMPVTFGVSRPRILLPADVDHWPHERLQVVLLHELAHVKRWDCLTQLLGQLACSLYWFNPLVWLASRQLRIERERACDDQVMDVGTKASDYAGHLLDMARTLRSARCSSLATLAIARRSQLEGRLLAILDPGLKRRGLNRIAAGAVAAVIVCVLLPLATVRLSAYTNKPTLEESMPGPSLHPANNNSGKVNSLDVQAEQYRVEQSSQPAANSPKSDEASPDQEVTDSGDAAQQKGDNPVIDTLREALKDDDPSMRQHALLALTQAGDQQPLAVLVEALKDPSWQVRANAATGLGLRGGRSSVDALVGALQDSNWQVREQAAWALGLRGDARAIEPLIDALKDESADVREKAAWALGLKGDRRSVEALMPALTDSSTRVRGMAAWALGLKGDSRAGDALKDAMKDPDKDVRQKAAWALGMLLMKLGGAPVGLPDADDGVDAQREFNRRGVPGGVSGGVPRGVSGGVPGGVSGGVPRGVSGGVPGGVSGGVHGGVSGGVPGSTRRVRGGVGANPHDKAKSKQKQK